MVVSMNARLPDLSATVVHQTAVVAGGLDLSRLPRAGARIRSNLKDFVAQTIREMIFSGQLQVGTRIDQDAIANAIGVSRMPLREALIVLEAEGIVEGRARYGTYVRAVTREDVQDHYKIYGLISGIAAERAAISLTDEAIAALADLTARAKSTTDLSDLNNMNFEFHRVINGAGTSHRLKAQLVSLSPGVITSYSASLVDRHSAAWQEHETIVDALIRRDAKAASSSMLQHLEHSGDRAVEALEDIGFWAADPEAESVQSSK